MFPICPPGLGVRQCRHGRLAPGPWHLDRRYWLLALRGTVDHHAVMGFVARGAGPVQVPGARLYSISIYGTVYLSTERTDLY